MVPLKEHLKIDSQGMFVCSLIGDQLIGPFMLEQHLTAGNYLNFLMNELLLLMEVVSLEIRCGIFFQQDGAPLHFGHQVTAYLNSSLQKSLDWSLPRSADLTHLIYFCGV
jgi:hypothetical protein